MAKLNRNATTGEYSIETAMDGEFVTLRLNPEGEEFLEQQDVEEGGRIPAELLVTLEENGWLSVAGEDVDVISGYAGTPMANESETNAPAGNVPRPVDVPLPSTRMESRPWMEQENVEAFRDETAATVAASSQPETKSGWSQADRSNANPLMHGEDAAFVGGVWFWVLVVAVVVIAVWGLVEIF